MILGICGSPRKQATEFVLDEALSMLRKLGFETQLFTVRGKSIGACQHCDYCMRKKVCKVKDDMHLLYPLIKNARSIVFASPVYNGGLSAQSKAVMDRCRALFAVDGNVLRGKVGMAIAVGGDRAGGQELALQQILTFYVLNGMIPVSGGPFGANLGATFWSKDTLEGVKADDEGWRTLKKTVKRFADFMKESELKTGEKK